MATTVNLRPRDNPRLTSTFNPPGQGVSNWSNEWGFYWEAYTNEGVMVRRADAGTPPFDMTARVTSDATDTEPRLHGTPNGRLYVAWTRGGTDVYIAECKGDDGFTWETPVVLFSGGTHPASDVSPMTGGEVIMAYVSGKIHVRRREAGDTAYDTEVTVKDDAAADIQVEDDCFSIRFIRDGAHRLNMVVRLLGGSGPSTLWSSDDGHTFTAYP